MKKTFKAMLSLALCLCIILSCSAVSFAAAKKDLTPIVIIPGFGQSETMVYDKDGSPLGDISEFTLEAFKTNEIIKNLTNPKKLSSLIKSTPDFSQYLADVLSDIFKAFRRNADGTPIYRTEVRQFNKPYSEYTDEERREVDSHINIKGVEEYDNIRYYFTYDTFGSFAESAESFHRFLNEVVLPQTGADKVNIVPVSQGGALFAGYLDLYKEDYKHIKKVVSIAPAYNGSIIVGDILNDRIKIYNADYLDDTALPLLFGDLLGGKDKGYAISAVLRTLLTNKQQSDLIKKCVRSAVDSLAINNTMMWALCPDEDYQSAKERLISDNSHAALRAETDRYFEARENLVDNLYTLMANGTTVHSLCCYDVGCFLSYLFESGEKNADDLLAPSSSSLGATCADTGKTLGNNYVSPHTNCDDPTHRHISPDNVLDASTSALPENTWYFKNVSHMSLNNRHDVKAFAAELIKNDNIKDVHTFPGQSQFVEFPEYEAVDGDNGFTYYYAPDGSLAYTEKQKQPENHFNTVMAKLFYQFIRLLKPFIKYMIVN